MRIHNLPLSRQTEDVARFVSNKAGFFEDIDLDESRGASMRVRIKINVHKPLNGV